jgi:hypothetical protein
MHAGAHTCVCVCMCVCSCVCVCVCVQHTCWSCKSLWWQRCSRTSATEAAVSAAPTISPCECVCVCLCVCACACACERVCVCRPVARKIPFILTRTLWRFCLLFNIASSTKEKLCWQVSHSHTSHCRGTCPVPRVGQNRIYTPYMTVYLVIFLPKIPYIHRICRVLANPTYTPEVKFEPEQYITL